MSQIKLSPNVSGTGIFTIASPGTSTDRTLTLPDNSGTVLTTATPGVPVNGPAFIAYQSSAQTPSASTWTKINLQTELFDTNANFDTSTSRFTPTVAGYYQVNGHVGMASSLTRFIVTVYKNGSESQRGYDAAGQSAFVSTIMYMNGSTDYIELYTFNTSGGVLTSPAATETYFNAVLVRAA